MEGASLREDDLRWLDPVDVLNELEDWRYPQNVKMLMGKRGQVLGTPKVGCRIFPLGYLIAEDLALMMKFWQFCLDVIQQMFVFLGDWHTSLIVTFPGGTDTPY